jgi:predicted RNA polymerase sigma factor
VDAVGVLDKSVSLKPNFFYSRLNRAKALIALGQLDSARADLQMAISLQRNDAEAAELLRRVDSASSASVGR